MNNPLIFAIRSCDWYSQKICLTSKTNTSSYIQNEMLKNGLWDLEILLKTYDKWSNELLAIKQTPFLLTSPMKKSPRVSHFNFKILKKSRGKKFLGTWNQNQLIIVRLWFINLDIKKYFFNSAKVKHNCTMCIMQFTLITTIHDYYVIETK